MKCNYKIYVVIFFPEFNANIHTLDDSIKQEPTLSRCKNKINIGPEKTAPAENATNEMGYGINLYLDLWFFCSLCKLF